MFWWLIKSNISVIINDVKQILLSAIFNFPGQRVIGTMPSNRCINKNIPLQKTNIDLPLANYIYWNMKLNNFEYFINLNIIIFKNNFIHKTGASNIRSNSEPLHCTSLHVAPPYIMLSSVWLISRMSPKNSRPCQCYVKG